MKSGDKNDDEKPHGGKNHGGAAHGDKSHAEKTHGEEAHGGKAHDAKHHDEKTHGGTGHAAKTHGQEAHGGEAHSEKHHAEKTQGHAGHADKTQGDKSAKNLPRVRKRTLRIIAVSVIAAMAAAFLLGFMIHHGRIEKREKMAKETRDRKLTVQVTKPKQTQKSFDLALPADVRAYAATSLYARTNGYLAIWTADINDRVKKGDVIAVISAPDTDADLEQAKANLNQQETSYQLAVATEDRYRGLISVQGVTQQQLDQFHSTREQAKANVGATAASVDRLKALVGFEKIIAPFDGVVTTRNYDVGALISATNIAPGQELFDLAEDDKLRVFVNIPQAYALLVKFNQPASLAFERNYPGRLFQGVVARSSGSLDPVTRTLHTEVDFNNDDPDHHIFPGMYGEVVFHIQRDHPVLTVPTSALLFEADGKQVAIVNSSNKIHFQKIVPGRDFGTEIEVIDGLKGDENIVANPSEQLTEGLAVSPQAEKKEDQKQGGQQQGDGKEKDKRQDGKDEH